MQDSRDDTVFMHYIPIRQDVPVPRFDVDAFLKQHIVRNVSAGLLREHAARLDARPDTAEAWSLLKDLAGACGVLDVLMHGQGGFPPALLRSGYSHPGLRDTVLLVRGHIEQAGQSLERGEVLQDAIEACRALAGYVAGMLA